MPPKYQKRQQRRYSVAARSSHGAVQRATQACRGQSLPPATTSTKSTAAMHQRQTSTVPVEESEQVAMQIDPQAPNCAAGKKHSYSETNSDSQSITGRHQHSRARKNNLDSALTSSSGRTSSTMMTSGWTQTDTVLDTINESDEDQLVLSQESMDYPQYYQKAALITSSGSDNSDSDMEIVLNPAPKERQRAQGKKSAQQKPSSRKKIKPGDDSDEELDTLDSDPTTRVFKIPSAVKNTDGGNSPFTIESSISLEDLRNTVAEKIGRHPNVVRLQYKLANDKVKAPTMSIQNERMRILLVPQRLASGKFSKHVPTKNTMVCFEDAAVVEGKKAETQSSNGKGKKKNEPAPLDKYETQ
ncbi:hypothetical protein JOM56_011564 [Amanita muscaria]